MTHLSRKPLGQEKEKKLIQGLQKILAHIGTEEEMESFILSLLSPTEQLMIAKRLAVFFLIQEGKSDAFITEALHLTPITVAKLRYFIESRGQGYQVAWKVLQDGNVHEEFKSLLADIFNYAAAAAGGRVKSTIL